MGVHGMSGEIEFEPIEVEGFGVVQLSRDLRVQLIPAGAEALAPVVVRDLVSVLEMVNETLEFVGHAFEPDAAGGPMGAFCRTCSNYQGHPSHRLSPGEVMER